MFKTYFDRETDLKMSLRKIFGPIALSLYVPLSNTIY